jgi:GNAT superfamily N-acetyltransferase
LERAGTLGAVDDLRSFAEDPMAHVPAGPDEERIADPRFIVTFSPGAHFWSVSVGRLRMDAGGVAPAVGEIRDLMRARRRDASVWSVSGSSTPADLAARLIDLGMEQEGTSDVLVLTREPARPATPAFDVREVRSLEDLHAWIDVSAGGFGWSEDDTRDERGRAQETWRAERENPAVSRLLAFDEGRPIAAGRAEIAPQGLFLGGGATLPADRRRGAMTALLAAAWDEAVRRGTPALVTCGGTMSAPILAGLGFAKIGEMVHLIDRL